MTLNNGILRRSSLLVKSTNYVALNETFLKTKLKENNETIKVEMHMN